MSLVSLLAPSSGATLATIEELTASTLVTSTITSNTSWPIWIAPFACTITQGSVMIWNSDVAASDTDYWTISLVRYRANAGAQFATKTTKTTGGEALTRRTDWNFDAVTFDPTYSVLQKGDAVGVQTTPTGAPTSLSLLQATIRYEPA